MINDPNPVPGTTVTQFSDQEIQDYLDASRDDVRYESLKAAPAIANIATTNNQAQFIFADYHSRYHWWEADAVIQGYQNSDFWKVLTVAASDYITGYWQFQLTPFVNGTAPGQFPPVFATGKVFDPFCAAADLLEIWAAKVVMNFDVVVGGQTFQQSQAANAMQKLANTYRMQAKPKTAKLRRDDVTIENKMLGDLAGYQTF
jgi:hypothetical protein